MNAAHTCPHLVTARKRAAGPAQNHALKRPLPSFKVGSKNARRKMRHGFFGSSPELDDTSMKRQAMFSGLMLTVTLLCFGQTAQQPTHDSRKVKRVVVGHLEIPRLDISVVVLEGATPESLADAAGHIEGTSLPGLSGNVGIAAHRDTFFGPLREIRPNDAITLRTTDGNFRYLVNRTEVVAPSDIGVLHQTSDAELTLVTCYPFRYRGPSPQRFIVHARSVRDPGILSAGPHSVPGGE